MVGMDLCAGIMWIGLEFSIAEPNTLLFLCTCQLDLKTVSEC